MKVLWVATKSGLCSRRTTARGGVATILSVLRRHRATAGLLLLLPLVLSPLAVEARQKLYRGAEYRTHEAFTYGRFEVRMKSAGGTGFLASFFTYHDVGQPVPVWNEIDIEMLGRYTNEAQFNTITPGQINHVHRHLVPFNPHFAFHEYGFEWTPDYVAWLVDGHEVYRQTGAHIQTLVREQKLMMNVWAPSYINWVGLLDPNVLPVYAYYDWVRYSAYTPGINDNFTFQWQDDFESWDQERWGKATHTWNGNMAQFIPDNIVFRDGYMILCLTHPDVTGYRGSIIVDLDLDPPYVIWAFAQGDRVDVYFSEALDSESAENPAHYRIDGATVLAARLDEDGRRVVLQVDGLKQPAEAVLVVDGVSDRSSFKRRAEGQEVVLVHGVSLPALINAGGDAREGAIGDSAWYGTASHGAIGGNRLQRSPGAVQANRFAPLYDTAYDGLTFYRVRVPDGRYDVTLLLADTESTAAGERIFDLYLEGELVLDDLDIVAEAGLATALEKSFANISVTDGLLDLYFKPEAGTATLSGLQLEARDITGAGANRTVPQNFAMRVYPNPFNPATRIAFTLAHAAQVAVDLFDPRGRRLQRLLDEKRAAGENVLSFDATGLAAGVFFVRLQVDGRIAGMEKVLYLK